MANHLYDHLFGKYAGRTSVFLTLPDGTEVTHDAFLRMAAQFAHVIRAAGVAVGDRMAVQVEKSAEALALYAACVQAGVIFLPLNTAYTAEEVRYFAENSGAKLILCEARAEAALAPIAAALGAVLETMNPDGQGSFTTKAREMPEVFETGARGPEDLAAFLYTSGTTGRSKGAMMTHRNLLSNADMLVDYWRFTERDVLLHALPIFHTHGLFVATNVCLVAGSSMIFLPKFDLEAVLGWLPKATALMGVPTFYTRLLGEARFTRDLVAHFRLFISGSAPLLAETHVAFEDRTGHSILERYGMTETNMNTSNPYEGERRAGTVGFALPGIELKITDPVTGETLPQGEIGLIEVRGANVFKGYWQMPEKTAAELREDGFFITGDLGQIDADGYVTIVGRNKDLVISGGYNIYPKEIELILDEQPGVLESAVIGVPHPDLGEVPVGILVPLPGAALDLAQIGAHLGQVLARNTMGKVQKNQFRYQFKGMFA